MRTPLTQSIRASAPTIALPVRKPSGAPVAFSTPLGNAASVKSPAVSNPSEAKFAQEAEMFDDPKGVLATEEMAASVMATKLRANMSGSWRKRVKRENRGEEMEEVDEDERRLVEDGEYLYAMGESEMNMAC